MQGEDDISALRAALDLEVAPTRVHALRQEGLPDGLLVVLRVATGDASALQNYSEHFRKTPLKLQRAADFYIEQILLARESDSYRILGASRAASSVELRRNFILICKWLHSGVGQDADRLIFQRRITDAWNNLKTPERRAEYDATLQTQSTTRVSRRSSRPMGAGRHLSHGGKFRGAPRIPIKRRSKRGLMFRLLRFLFGRSSKASL